MQRRCGNGKLVEGDEYERQEGEGTVNGGCLGGRGEGGKEGKNKDTFRECIEANQLMIYTRLLAVSPPVH